MAKFQDLIEFVERARRNRKYPDNTAYALNAALRLYEAQLNEEELASVEKFQANFEPITRNVFSKNQSKVTASSLTTYRSRVQRVLSDYDKYADPVKMSNWNPMSPSPRVPKEKTGKERTRSHANGHGQSHEKGDMHHITVALRPGVEASVILPFDVTAAEVAKVKKFLDAATGE